MFISGYATVIVPVHNGALTLRRCLDALAEQTYRPLEIVVVDDGSDDATPGWVRSFRMSHPELPVRLVSQAHAGSGAALAAGLAVARGEFVAFAHQADEWRPDKLARQVRALQARPDAGFSLAGVTQESGPTRLRWAAGRARDGLLLEPVPLSALVARRRAVEAAGGFDADPALAAATDLCCRLARQTPCVRVKEDVAVCQRAPRGGDEVKRVAATLAKLMREGCLSERRCRHAESRLHAVLGWQALIADDPQHALACFREALAVTPYDPLALGGLGCARLDAWLFAKGWLKPRAAGGLAAARR